MADGTEVELSQQKKDLLVLFHHTHQMDGLAALSLFK